MNPRKAWGLALLLSILGAALLTHLVPELGDSVGIGFMLIGYLVGGTLFVRARSSHDGKERLAWTLIGAAFFVAAAGILAFGVFFALQGDDLPAFGPLDVFFIAAYLINLAGFWVLPHLQGGPIRRARIFIDGLVGSISLGVLAWVLFLNRFWDQFNGSQNWEPWEAVIGSTYPLVDIATLVVVMLVTLRRSTLRFDLRIVLLGIGFSGQAVADLLYLQQGLGASFSEAGPRYPIFLLAVACFVGAGLLVEYRPPAREYAERRTPWWAMVAPYGAAAVMLVVLAVRISGLEAPTHETTELLVASLIVICLIILRQALAIREQRELVERQRSALVSSISHELRTPLTAMVGFLDVLADPEQEMNEESRQELMAVVSQQAIYMARIVSDLVMLNRRDPDLGLTERTVELESLVSRAVSSLDVDSGSGVVTEVEPGVAVHVDPDRIHQVLVNLLINASRYGGPNRLVVAKKAGEDVVLEVHDDGPGVPKRYEFMIWDRFERGAHRYDAGTPGTGIGLALVAMLARAHQGFAAYRQSERLGGACFSVILPGRVRERSRNAPLESVGRRDP